MKRAELIKFVLFYRQTICALHDQFQIDFQYLDKITPRVLHQINLFYAYLRFAVKRLAYFYFGVRRI